MVFLRSYIFPKARLQARINSIQSTRYSVPTGSLTQVTDLLLPETWPTMLCGESGPIVRSQPVEAKPSSENELTGVFQIAWRNVSQPLFTGKVIVLPFYIRNLRIGALIALLELLRIPFSARKGLIPTPYHRIGYIEESSHLLEGCSRALGSFSLSISFLDISISSLSLYLYLF